MTRSAFTFSIGILTVCLQQLQAGRVLITRPVDDGQRAVLAGNTRSEANAKNDLGPVEDSLPLSMFLQLKRSAEQEAAARDFVESLTSKQSPNFHKWVTAAEFGARFGASAEDIATVTRWLESQGFHVNGVPAHRMVIDFSGTAGAVRKAFHTEIHYLNVNGRKQFANMNDPQIPAALAPAVTGVVSMSDIKPVPMYRPKAQYTINPDTEALVPGDLTTIYNLNPLFAAGYSGLGQTVVVVEDTDLSGGTADWNSFRKTFGLNQYTAGTLNQSHPQGISECLDPGINSDDFEAALDVEWASVAAPNAAIVMASCEDTTTFGGFIALQNLLAGSTTPPGLVSISYGEPETEAGAAFNAFINTLYQLAAAEGVSVFVSSGDSTAAAADRSNAAAIFGISVSGFTSTPYNVSVGGTDFGDFVNGTTANFWNPVNGTYYNSAKSYVPEIPWNNTCGSSLGVQYYGFLAAYGLGGLCNAYPFYGGTIGGSGGPSGCATGAKINGDAVSGSCSGWPKPSWQSVPGNPNDGVRDIPDVSLFSASGFWGRYYVVCYSAEVSCNNAPSAWPGGGGTSFASPIMAGIQAVLNQALGTTNIGNPNPVYYSIANSQYATASGTAACNSTLGPAPACAFNDVTQGDIVAPCAGTVDCFTNGQAEGVLSTSNTTFQPAYPAGPGWDFATGLGSVNAANLLKAFVGAASSTGAPTAPVLLSPANMAPSASVTPVLSWKGSADATSYDVYLGTVNPPPMVANTTGVVYAPAALSPATQYYWAIGARNSAGANVSMSFTFTTGCASALSVTSAAATPAGGPGTVAVNAPDGCAWTATSNAPFLTISSGGQGTGNGTVNYAVAATSAASRTGSLTVAGQTFTVNQTGGAMMISTLAGGAPPATPALGTNLSIPVGYGIASDAAGNVYFPSPYLNAVFKKDPTGIVTRVAGTGASGEEGVGGQAAQVELDFPEGVALDSHGNLYVADSDNCRVLMISPAGIVSPIAGNADCGYTGDTGPAALASLDYPTGLAVDSAGNVFISDTDNCVVRKVDTNGIITTVAGTGSCGFGGDGGPASNARLYYPYGIALDGSGNLYIADTDNYRIRAVSSSGVISTVAGNGRCCYGGDGGPAIGALLYLPTGVAVDGSGNLYIADNANARVRMVNSGGTISTIAGGAGTGFAGDGGQAASARLSSPEGVAVDGSGNVYIAEYGSLRIRQVNASGSISTVVGGAINDGGPAAKGWLKRPTAVLRDGAGNTYISDPNDNRVRKVSAAGTISTVAGNGTTGFSGDGAVATAGQLNSPQQVALDAAGNLYIADSQNYRVRMVDTSGNLTTIAGTGLAGYTGDNGPATGAQIGTPVGLAVDAAGNVYFSDTSHSVVRRIDTGGNITTYAGTGTSGYSGDNGPANSARLNLPLNLSVDAAGNLYIADTDNFRVRKVDTTGMITTVAGTGACCYGGDGGQATKAQLYYPEGVSVDGAGNLYISDYDNERIRMVSPMGVISTIAGNGSYGYQGDGGFALGATFKHPYGISADAQGNIAVVDEFNAAIRLLTRETSVANH